MSPVDVKSDGTATADTLTASQVVGRFTAEQVRLLLQLFELRAAIVEGDPLRSGIALAEIIFRKDDRAKAIEALNTLYKTRHTEDWCCPSCSEEVPDTFDLCWNCGALHPELDDEENSSKERRNAGNERTTRL